MTQTKINQLREAAQRIEKKQAGFTVEELLAKLKWASENKHYIQNTMALLTKKGQARKLNDKRPVKYTFRGNEPAGSAAVEAGTAGAHRPSGASAAKREQAVQTASEAPAAKIARPAPESTPPAKAQSADLLQQRQAPARQAEQPPKMKALVSLENIDEFDITLEAIGAGVFRRTRELERKIYDLEMQLVESRRNLDEANKRISELNHVIERQNQTIASRNRYSRPPQPAARVKEVLSPVPRWKRRFTD